MLTAHLIANRVYRTCKTQVLHVQVSSSSCHSENVPAPRASFITSCKLCPSTAMSDHTAFSRVRRPAKLLQSNHIEYIVLDGNELWCMRAGLSDSLHVCLPAFRLPVNDLHSPSAKGRCEEKRMIRQTLRQLRSHHRITLL